MMFVNTYNSFEKAVNENDTQIAERLLLSSDSKIELIRNYSRKNDIQNLLDMLNSFKSRGLVFNIETICTLHNNFRSEKNIDIYLINEKIKLQHIDNLKSNKVKHLKPESFLKAS